MSKTQTRAPQSMEYELEPAKQDSRPMYCVLCNSHVGRLTSIGLCADCSKELGPKGRRSLVRCFYQ